MFYVLKNWDNRKAFWGAQQIILAQQIHNTIYKAGCRNLRISYALLQRALEPVPVPMIIPF